MKRKSFLLAAATGATMLFKSPSASASKPKTNEFVILSNGYGLTEWEGSYIVIAPDSVKDFKQEDTLSFLKHGRAARIDPAMLSNLNKLSEKVAIV